MACYHRNPRTGAWEGSFHDHPNPSRMWADPVCRGHGVDVFPMKQAGAGGTPACPRGAGLDKNLAHPPAWVEAVPRAGLGPPGELPAGRRGQAALCSGANSEEWEDNDVTGHVGGCLRWLSWQQQPLSGTVSSAAHRSTGHLLGLSFIHSDQRAGSSPTGARSRMGRPDLETLASVLSRPVWDLLWLGARIHFFLWEANKRIVQHKVHC